MKKKMGRPTDNPKTAKISIRLDETTLKALDDFCKKRGFSRTLGVDEAIKRMVRQAENH